MKKSYDKKIFRLVGMLSKFNQGSPVKTPDFAREFGVTHRTVQRDMRILESVGFALVHDHSGHKFGDGVSIQKILTTPQEKFLLDVFWILFSKIGPPFDSIAENFLSRTLSVLQGKDSTEAFTTSQKRVIMQEVEKFSKQLCIRLGKRKEFQQVEGRRILKPQMPCTNCINFKQRVLKGKDVTRVNINDGNTYGRCQYPVNKVILKQVHKDGSCEIFYCNKALQKKIVYTEALKIAGKIAPIHEFCPGRE